MTNSQSSSLPNQKGKKGLIDLSSPTLKTIVVSIAHAMHDTYSGFIAPLLPFLIERLSLLKVEAGVFSLVFQGVSILQPIIGHIADRTNLRKVALLAPAVTAIFLSLLGPVQSFSTAIFYCLIAGLSSATLHAILPPLAASFSKGNEGKSMSIWMIGGELGVMLGPILITAIITSFSANATPWLMIGGIVVSIALSIILKDLPYHNGHAKEQTKIPFKRLATIFIPITAIIIARSPLRSNSLLYLPVFLLENGASVWFAGISLSLMQGIGLLGTIGGGFLTDRKGYRVTMIVSISISALAMVVASLSHGVFQILFLCIFSIASLMILPVGMALMQRSFPENRSLANGLYLATTFAINALAGVFSGYLYDQFGGQQSFLWSGVMALFGIPFVFLLPRDDKLTNK